MGTGELGWDANQNRDTHTRQPGHRVDIDVAELNQRSTCRDKDPPMGDGSRQSSIRINAVDPLGRSIDPAVLAAAEQIGERALVYGERLLRDPAMTVNLLEESAALVSRALRQKHNTGSPNVHNLRAYIFMAFRRRVNRARQKDPVLANAVGVSHLRLSEPSYGPDGLTLKVLVDELLMRCDPAIQDMFLRRERGFSWAEIARAYGTTTHAAESKFSQALRRVRRELGLDHEAKARDRSKR